MFIIMRRVLFLIKSSFHDPRCCDSNTDGDGSLLWRAKADSITCLLDNSGYRTGYAHVATLEQYNSITGDATGETKPNAISDANYIADYSDLSKCSINTPSPTGSVHAYNGCTGQLQLTVTNEANNQSVTKYINNGVSIDFEVPNGVYRVTCLVSQNQPPAPSPALHVQGIVNDQLHIVPNGSSLVFQHVNSPIDISIRPTTQATT